MSASDPVTPDDTQQCLNKSVQRNMCHLFRQLNTLKCEGQAEKQNDRRDSYDSACRHRWNNAQSVKTESTDPYHCFPGGEIVANTKYQYFLLIQTM